MVVLELQNFKTKAEKNNNKSVEAQKFKFHFKNMWNINGSIFLTSYVSSALEF